MNLGQIIILTFFVIFVIFWVSNVGCQNTCCTAVLGCCTLVQICKRIFKSIWRCSESIRLVKSHFALPRNKRSWHVTLNSKYPTIFDVREYVFWISPECFLMSWRSRNLLGPILNEFGVDHFHIFFCHFCHFLSVECRVPECLLHSRSGLSHLDLDM